MELVNSNQMSLGAAYKSSTSILSPMGWERTGLSFGCRFFQLLGMAPPSVLIGRCAPELCFNASFSLRDRWCLSSKSVNASRR